ncbi:hypothetical protein GQR58_030163 [Nymphon striatum]|nr:hypothetical protein GQR58_030163 [Nymphon striatum]
MSLRCLGSTLSGDDAQIEAVLRENAGRAPCLCGRTPEHWRRRSGLAGHIRPRRSFDPFFDEIGGRDGLLLLTGGYTAGEFDPDKELLVTFTAGSRDQVIDLGERGNWQSFTASITLGIDHIKTGPDHILFVLALLLPSVLFFSSGWKPVEGFGSALWRVLKIATFFTIAHSITFTLAGMGWLPTPPSKILISLLGRNVGIEIGQVVVILVLFPGLYLLRRTPAYPPFLAIASVALAALATLWSIERVAETDLGTDGIVEGFASVPAGYWHHALGIPLSAELGDDGGSGFGGQVAVDSKAVHTQVTAAVGDLFQVVEVVARARVHFPRSNRLPFRPSSRRHLCMPTCMSKARMMEGLCSPTSPTPYRVLCGQVLHAAHASLVARSSALHRSARLADRGLSGQRVGRPGVECPIALRTKGPRCLKQANRQCRKRSSLSVSSTQPQTRPSASSPNRNGYAAGWASVPRSIYGWAVRPDSPWCPAACPSAMAWPRLKCSFRRMKRNEDFNDGPVQVREIGVRREWARPTSGFKTPVLDAIGLTEIRPGVLELEKSPYRHDMTSTTDLELIERATALADDLLFPLALEADAHGDVPTKQLDALAAAGMYGISVNCAPATITTVIETLASGCMTTALLGRPDFDERLDALRAELDQASHEELPAARADAALFAVTASTALVASVGGRGVTMSEHAQRLHRESMFLLVQGQTPQIKALIPGPATAAAYPCCISTARQPSSTPIRFSPARIATAPAAPRRGAPGCPARKSATALSMTHPHLGWQCRRSFQGSADRRRQHHGRERLGRPVHCRGRRQHGDRADHAARIGVTLHASRGPVGFRSHRAMLQPPWRPHVLQLPAWCQRRRYYLHDLGPVPRWPWTPGSAHGDSDGNASNAHANPNRGSDSHARHSFRPRRRNRRPRQPLARWTPTLMPVKPKPRAPRRPTHRTMPIHPTKPTRPERTTEPPQIPMPPTMATMTPATAVTPRMPMQASMPMVEVHGPTGHRPPIADGADSDEADSGDAETDGSESAAEAAADPEPARTPVAESTSVDPDTPDPATTLTGVAVTEDDDSVDLGGAGNWRGDRRRGRRRARGPAPSPGQGPRHLGRVLGA